jgi:hypothetical protein
MLLQSLSAAALGGYIITHRRDRGERTSDRPSQPHHICPRCRTCCATLFKVYLLYFLSFTIVNSAFNTSTHFLASPAPIDERVSKQRRAPGLLAY